MSLDWFRWYHGTVSDPKLALIARRAKQPRPLVIAVWVALLEHASQACPRGRLDGFDAETLAVALDVEETEITAVMEAMAAKGMIVEQRITAWDRRQPQREDGAAERARLWREQQKQRAENATERNRTQPNADEREQTPENKNERLDKDKDKDTDTEKDNQHVREVVGGVGGASPDPGADAPTPPRKPTASKKISEPLPPCPDWLPSDTWQAYINHRHSKRKPLSAKAAELTLRDLQKAKAFGHDPVSLIEAAIANGWTGCVFPEKHFQPAQPIGVTHANGYRRPLSVPERFAENLQGLREPIYDDRGNQVNPNYRPF